jgi:hypothetical protein
MNICSALLCIALHCSANLINFFGRRYPIDESPECKSGVLIDELRKMDSNQEQF